MNREIKKAILTGGGRATRLRPITSTINKHLLPLANKPMIFHAIEKVVAAGIEEIFININPDEKDLQREVGDGSRWGVKISYFEQTGGPQGIAHVVALARQFIGDDPFLFYLSDNILLGGISEMVEEFANGAHDCLLALSKVDDPERFGVPVFDGAGALVEILEKPAIAPNNYAVTGIYLYGPKIFFDAFQKIQKSTRGEYEISDVHTALLKQGKRVGYKEITGWWKDTGKPEDLLLANQLLLEQLGIRNKELGIMVAVAAGASIGEDVALVGPVMIGDDCHLENCVIGPNATLGRGCVVRGGRLENCILLDEVMVEGNIFLKDSLIGKKARVTNSSAMPLPQAKVIIGEGTVIEYGVNVIPEHHRESRHQ